MIQPCNARRARPNMPHYGVMPGETDAMLTWDWVERQMIKARNYWVCSLRADGRPHAAPVWGAWVDGSFYFGTDRSSVKARNIARDKRVVLHLESGDETVIFEGELVEAQPDEPTRIAIGAAYTEKYGFDPELDEDDALTYRLIPRKAMAWLERDYPATATYWRFDV